MYAEAKLFLEAYQESDAYGDVITPIHPCTNFYCRRGLQQAQLDPGLKVKCRICSRGTGTPPHSPSLGSGPATVAYDAIVYSHNVIDSPATIETANRLSTTFATKAFYGNVVCLMIVPHPEHHAYRIKMEVDIDAVTAHVTAPPRPIILRNGGNLSRRRSWITDTAYVADQIACAVRDVFPRGNLYVTLLDRACNGVVMVCDETYRFCPVFHVDH